MCRRNVTCLPAAMIVFGCCLAESSALHAASAGRSDHASLLYPHELDKRPTFPSPYLAEDATEIVTAVLKNGKYVCIPVTVENGGPLHYSYRVPFAYGKDRQLYVNRDAFPTLAQTGLHADAELAATPMITGFPVDLITYIGRPGRFSGAGFMADDETILSVLKADNNLVRKLGLTHPQMAWPLYHVWNMLLQDIERGTFRRFSSIPRFFYNEHEITLRAESTKGWQISIFQDEIQGTFDINVRRTLRPAENSFLRRKHPDLSDAQMTELQEKLTHLRFSEMLPYYIMGYGFYEGHTSFRADPLAIACIFGLRSIEEIENAFPGRLYETLTRQFTETVRPQNSKP